VPLPVQLLKLKPLAGVALIETTVPLFFHPLGGLTVPPVPWAIVRRYCVLNVAVKVVLAVGAPVCELTPWSLQLLQTY
jgi:hypothetical protein